MAYETVSHSQAMDLLSKHASAQVIDVRDAEAYREGHIPGAQHLAMEALSEFCQSADKEQPILIYCYHGISSRAVAQHFVDQGFVTVYSLNGGFAVWQEHHPVETSGASN